MPKPSENEVTVSRARDQLYWFLNKLLSISENPVNIEGYDEVICFPVNLLSKEETGLFPLGRYASAVEFDTEDQEYASYCREMLEKIKRDIYKLGDKYIHFNAENFSWWEDNNEYSKGYNIVLDYDHRPLLKAYLENRLKKKGGAPVNGNSIEKIEILKNDSEQGRIKVYVNGNYNEDPLDFSRGKNWKLMYKIAEKIESVAYESNKQFYDYFNYNKLNPLYAKERFEITKILKEEDGCIVPNIKIEITTQNKITRQLKST